MAAGKWTLFGTAKKKILEGSIDLDTNSFKMALFTSAQFMHSDLGATGVFSDLTAEITGTGYTAGGAAVVPAVGTATSAGGVASINAITAGGSGYATAPAISFTGGGSPTIAAAATAYIVGGVVIAIAITNPGAGYTSAPTVVFTGGGFSVAATATCVLQKTVPVTLTTPTVSWTTATITAKYAAIYRSDGATLHLVAYCDLETTVAAGLSATAATFSVVTAGIFDLL
jgi:hypothetical protein